MESSKSGREREADNYDEFALEVVLKKKNYRSWLLDGCLVVLVCPLLRLLLKW